MNIQQAMSWYKRQPPDLRFTCRPHFDGRNPVCIYPLSFFRQSLGRVWRPSYTWQQLTVFSPTIEEDKVRKILMSKLDALKRDDIKRIWFTKPARSVGKSLHK